MVNIVVATKVRGAFKAIFNSEDINANFICDEKKFYNTKSNSLRSKITSKLGYSFLADVLGVIQRVKISDPKADLYFSYNRFLDADKPYILYVEHPVALYHYRLKRGQLFIGRNKISKFLKDENLKAIVFQAKFSERTFEKLVGKFEGNKKQIYLIQLINEYVNIDSIEKKCKDEVLNLLFVAQGSRFVSKCGLELLRAYAALKDRYKENIHLTILTQISEVKEYIHQGDGVEWIDYSLNSQEMKQLYARSSILMMVSSDDSINAVTLEAMNAGLAVISSDMSGFPEMVEEGKNGFMISPKWAFFDKKGYPNPTVWNHRKETLYSTDISKNIVNFMIEKVSLLYEDRELLCSMAVNSFEKARKAPFDRDYIVSQWNELIEEITH